MKYISIILVFLMVTPVFSQDETPVNGGMSAFIFDTGVGAGAVVSSNLVNSGALFSDHMNFLVKVKRHRVGIGFGVDYFLTPENLTRMVIGQTTANVSKGYIMYDWMVFKWSPVNIGVGAKFGSFANNKDSTQVDDTAMFSSLGLTAEFGSRKFSVYVRPEIEYKSYGKGSIHKELSTIANVGLRFKFMTKEEKARIQAKKDNRWWKRKKKK